MSNVAPALIAILGLVGGLGAGLMLRPPDVVAAQTAAEIDAAPEEEAAAHGEAGADHSEAPPHETPVGAHEVEDPPATTLVEGKPGASGHGAGQAEAPGHDDAPTDFVKLNNQFVIPVVRQGRVTALVILALSVEVTAGGGEEVYAREPKLRDAMLQVMFDHSNAGGFDGVFTDGANLILLRAALKEVAVKVLGTVVRDVLISDISRQDT